MNPTKTKQYIAWVSVPHRITFRSDAEGRANITMAAQLVAGKCQHLDGFKPTLLATQEITHGEEAAPEDSERTAA